MEGQPWDCLCMDTSCSGPLSFLLLLRTSHARHSTTHLRIAPYPPCNPPLTAPSAPTRWWMWTMLPAAPP